MIWVGTYIAIPGKVDEVNLLVFIKWVNFLWVTWVTRSNIMQTKPDNLVLEM